MIFQMLKYPLLLPVLLLLLVGNLTACATRGESPPILSQQSPIALRAMQIRAFDTSGKRRLTHAVIATLQDLGYTVEKIDYDSGTISAAKLDTLRLTVVIYSHGLTQMSVRANAIVKVGLQSTQVDDPGFYQKLFFEPLSRAVFLTALNVEDDAGAPPPPLPPEPSAASKPQHKP